MKMTIESTDEIVLFSSQRGMKPYKARVWIGRTESGMDLECLIPRISVREEDQARFAEELLDSKPLPDKRVV